MAGMVSLNRGSVHCGGHFGAASLPKVKMPKRDPHLDKVAPR